MNKTVKRLDSNLEEISSAMGSMAAAFRKALQFVATRASRIRGPIDTDMFKSKIFIR